MRREAHGGFGERPGETGQRQRWNRAPGRLSEELAAAGIAAHVAEPADTAFARGRKRHAKTDKTDSRHLRDAAGRGPAAGVLDPARATSWSAGRCWRPTMTCGPSTPPGRSGSTRCCSTRAPRRWARRALRTDDGLAALRAAAAAHLSPAGQLQVDTALDMLAVLEARLDVLRHQLLARRPAA